MYYASGCSGPLLLPLLDNQIGGKHLNKEKDEDIQLATNKSVDEVLSIVKDLFTTAAERDIFTGDGVYINIITLDGIEEQFFNLRQD